MRKNHKKIEIIRMLGIISLLVVSGSLSAAAQVRASTDEFIQKTAAGNKFEIDTSKIAEEKAKGGKVRDFAREMIEDHTKAGKDFMAALEKDGKDNPPPDSSPTADQKQALDDLRKLAGADLDKKYIDVQVDAHDQTVALFQNYVDNGDDKVLKDFARKTLPVLQRHQMMAKALKDSE